MALKASDIRHLRTCGHCTNLGDGRKMLKVDDALLHDACAIATMSEPQLLRLPLVEREKITFGAAGVPLMRKLMSARGIVRVIQGGAT